MHHVSRVVHTSTLTHAATQSDVQALDTATEAGLIYNARVAPYLTLHMPGTEWEMATRAAV
jgi:hypothetical protein